MHTVKLYIEDYLAEYLIGKWGIDESGLVQIPYEVYLIHDLCALTVKKNRDKVEPSFNIQIILPNIKTINKNPAIYNHMSRRGSKVFEKQVRSFFRADLHEFIDQKKHEDGISIKDTCYIFCELYNIESFNSDSMAKNYNRWRNRIRAIRKRNPISR